jgi:hypothetical protein
MDFGQLLELTSHLSVLVASCAAVWGMTGWRREFRGKREIELAEDVLCLVYRAEWAIEAVRFPAWDQREGQAREIPADETPEEKEARDRANVVFKRIRDNSDTFAELHTLRFRFMASFDRDKAKPFDELRGIVNEIWVAAEELAQLWERELTGHAVNEDDVTFFRKIIWSHGREDEIKGRLQEAVQCIEAMCRPIIEGQASRGFYLRGRALRSKELAKP